MNAADISLTADQQAIIASRVTAGMYDSPKIMIDQAIRILEETEDRKAREKLFFERELKPALDELDRGEGTPLDMAEIIAEANREWDAEGIPQ